MEAVKLRSSATLMVDVKDNVCYSSDFKLIIGTITEDYRFVPSNTCCTTDQGYTPEILSALADLIRVKAGIGQVRNIPVESEELKPSK